MKGCLSVVILACVIVIGVGYLGSPKKRASNEWGGPSTSDAEGIRQKGYFKDDRGNRMYTLELPPGGSAAMARAHAASLAGTNGQTTSAYFYLSGAKMPVDGVTLAKNYFAAMATIDRDGLSRPVYVYVKNFNGSANFADCLSQPANDLCKRVE